MGDTRTDPGHYYPGGKVRAKSGTAPQELIVQWSDVQGKPQIAPLPDRYKDSDVKGKINEIASKFATVVVAALIGWTACADITVQKKRKDQIYNDEQVVVDVTGGGGVDTNEVERIANRAVETNAVTVGLSSSVSALQSATNALQSQVSGLESSKADKTSGVLGLLGVIGKEINMTPVGSGRLIYRWGVDYASEAYTALSTEFADRAEKINVKSNSLNINKSIEFRSPYSRLDNSVIVTSGGSTNTVAFLSNISASDPAFSNAVLAVQIDTNLVANIGELREFFDGLPVGTVGTSLGGVILALLAAAAYLKKKTELLKADGTAEDDFATDLMQKQVAKDAIDERTPYALVTGELKDRSIKLYDATSAGVTVTLPTLATLPVGVTDFEAWIDMGAEVKTVTYSPDTIEWKDGKVPTSSDYTASATNIVHFTIVKTATATKVTACLAGFKAATPAA